MTATLRTYKNPVCRGSKVLGTACGRCERCLEEDFIRLDPCADCGICEEPKAGARHPIQPIGRDFALADGVAVKQMTLPAIGMLVPQHSHRYDHTSMLAVGAVEVWADGYELGSFVAPCPIFIKAGVKHTFLSLEANTVIYCIHRIDRTGQIEVAEEHHLVKE